MYHRVLRPLIGDTLEYRQEYIKRSAIFWADEINEPTLILHGDNDNRVNISQAENLAIAMKKAKKNVSFHIFSGGDHSLRLTHEVENTRDSLILDWFDQYLIK